MTKPSDSARLSGRSTLRKSAIIATGALAFDLGVMVLSGHAAPMSKPEVGVALGQVAAPGPADKRYLKVEMKEVLVSSYQIGGANTAAGCLAKGGKVAPVNDVPTCQIPASEPAAPGISLNFAKVQVDYLYLKIDTVNTVQACATKGGKVVDRENQRQCQLPAPASAPTRK